MPTVRVPSGQVWYERFGAQRRPLLLVTGLAGSASYWTPQRPLGEHFDVIAYDHLGVGRSSARASGHSVEGMAEDAIGLLDALGLERVDIVGHSTGGCILQVIAALHPHRVRRAVIASSWVTSDWRFARLFRQRQDTLMAGGVEAYARWGALLNYPASWVLERRATLEEAEQAVVGSCVKTTSDRINAILAFDGSSYLSRVAAPAALVCAEDDQVTPLHMTEAIAAALPSSTLELFSDGGHCFTTVHAERFNTFVRSWLDVD